VAVTLLVMSGAAAANNQSYAPLMSLVGGMLVGYLTYSAILYDRGR
jgi:hypothetical protein